MSSKFVVGQVVAYRGHSSLWWDEHLRVLDVSRNSAGIEVVLAKCYLGESWFLPSVLVPASGRCPCDTCSTSAADRQLSTAAKIAARVAMLKESVSLSDHQRVAVASAEQWLAEGALSRYSNHDFDVLNRLG